MKDSLENLKKIVFQTTSNDVWSLIENGLGIAYAGIDPTGAGIHIGHLLWIHILIHCLKLGNKVIILVGGFTGSIGDPTDKTQTRNKLNDNIVNNNVHGLFGDIKKIFKPYGDQVIYVNNNDWLGNMKLAQYMEYGYHLSVNRKVNMETFGNRLKNSNQLTMTEFMYPDLQMIDFCYLNRKYGCNVQVGGADQWGNIAFGTHYTGQINKTNVYGIVSHLLTDSSGAKFSKSTGAFYARNYEETYHGCMNLTDDMCMKIANMFDVMIDGNPQNTKRNLAKYIISLFEPYNYENIYDYILEKANVLFKSKNAENIKDEYFIDVHNGMLSNVLMEVFKLADFEAKFAIKDRSIKIDSVVVDEDCLVPVRCKVSYGKKYHVFIHVIPH